MTQLLLAALAAVAIGYPVYSPGSAGDTCDKISCKPVDCKPPFEYKSPEEMGTCCPLCWAETVKTPGDRSFVTGLSGGVGPNNAADPVLCRDVMCPPLHCDVPEQFFDGRCCTKCQSAAAPSAADFAASYKV
ncbi:unnamed protein product [Prorocentrum cordatum]|uniref:Uncharacterized protein n=1 Tax=Prorocentrum cordatum TaxID=2364126 RepID=A0ABN9U392_9DINO|nr:unnamed protein product [Polarella glacialis]